MPDPTPAPSGSIVVYFIQYNQLQPLPTEKVFLFNPTMLMLDNIGGSNPTAYQVTFNLMSNIPGATITAEDPVGPTPPDLKSSGSGTTGLTLTFNNTGLTAPLRFHYRLTVNAGGEAFTSDDPEIEVPPPT